MSRTDYVDRTVSRLTDWERRELAAVARADGHGGGVLEEPLRTKAVEAALAFAATGRLRMDVYYLFV